MQIDWAIMCDRKLHYYKEGDLGRPTLTFPWTNICECVTLHTTSAGSKTGLFLNLCDHKKNRNKSIFFSYCSIVFLTKWLVFCDSWDQFEAKVLRDGRS